MATTFALIANRAITLVGGTPITSLDDDTEEGRVCKRMYEQTRDQLLRDHTWNFNIKRKEIAADTTAPIYEFANAYTWPVDCLRILKVETDEEWQIEGRKIVTDAAAPLQIIYGSQVTDATLFDAKFIEAYAVRLAADICFDITASLNGVAQLEKRFRLLMGGARLVDAQESQEEQTPDWLQSRN